MMGRISLDHLAAAISKVRSMDLRQKETLADEIFAHQRNLLASVLVQPRFGVTCEKMEFLIGLLVICYQAMKETALPWPLISEDDQEYQIERETAILKHFDTLGGAIGERFANGHLERYPERALMAFVSGEVSAWLGRLAETGKQDESDKYVMMAVATLVNCIAYANVDSPDTPTK